MPGPQQKTPRGCRSTAPCARGARPPPGPFPSAPGACPGSSPSPARGASTKLSLPSLPALGFVCKAPGANISVPPGSRGTRSPVPGPGGGTNAPLADGSPRSASGPVLQDVGVPITQLCRARDLCCHLCPCPHYFVAPSSPAWVRPCSSRSPAPSWAHVCSADFVPWGIPHHPAPWLLAPTDPTENAVHQPFPSEETIPNPKPPAVPEACSQVHDPKSLPLSHLRTGLLAGHWSSGACVGAGWAPGRTKSPGEAL